ncbi:MAG TPA: papain-like cysteine protease family protein [Thermoanaerobaculia bacterium]|jgi:hypothetical protein|nr:papain-like cysteine protease family protein [Thermoanaerobaculia bacterium]
MTLPQIILNGLTDLHPHPAAAAVEERILKMPFQRQLLENWCWAAVGLMVRTVFGDTDQTMATQCKIANVILHTVQSPPTMTCCPEGNDVKECNQPTDLTRALGSHHDSTLLTNKTADFLIENIKTRQHPVAVRIEWVGIVGLLAGHFVLIKGYRKRADASVILHVCDPRYAEPIEYPFQQFLDHYESGSDGITGKWERSFTTKGNKIDFEKKTP